MKRVLLAMMFCVACSTSAFAENFESLTVGEAPPNPPWNLNGGLTVRDSATIAPFGANNQYLETIGGAEAADVWRFNQNLTPDSPIATVSFDFYWDEANNAAAGGNTDNWFRWAVRTDAGGSQNWLDVGTGPTRQIRVGTDTEEIDYDFDFNTAVRVDLVYNVSGATVNYGDGASIPDDSIEVWIDGELREDDLAFNRPPTNNNSIDVQFLWHNNGGVDFQNGLAYYDNFDVASDARVTFGMDPDVLGDFDMDGDVDLADLDQYNGNIGMAATGGLEALDLNDDGTVGADDFIQHYSTLVQTSNGQTGTFAGDVNLDGTVNVLGDAFALVGNLNNGATSWSQGDLNADGTVNVLGDAFLLVGNLGNSNNPAGAASASAVPEPGSLSLLALAGVAAVARRKR